MIAVEFDPARPAKPEYIPFWTEWLPRAQAATMDAIDGFETWWQRNDGTDFDGNFKQEIWAELKKWLRRNVYYRKCAYCERMISGAQPDAEHFRPKGSVKIKSGGRLEKASGFIDDPLTGTPRRVVHPGYFWLAYDWRNLVPACKFCNSGKGKNDRFEVGAEHVVLVRRTPEQIAGIPASDQPIESPKWPGYYYLSPASLDSVEVPLLLNPLNPHPERNPRKHITFGVGGIESAVDDNERGYGRVTIDIFQLFDEELRQDRQAAQEDFQDKYYDARRRSRAEAQRVLEEYMSGRKPFSAAALDYAKIEFAGDPLADL